jgi:hypothetical protein
LICTKQTKKSESATLSIQTEEEQKNLLELDDMLAHDLEIDRCAR